jgi:hypothetical protein
MLIGARRIPPVFSSGNVVGQKITDRYRIRDGARLHIMR